MGVQLMWALPLAVEIKFHRKISVVAGTLDRTLDETLKAINKSGN
tara:strand:- start:125 stop:259 length:135 start_codon:yes stop_codon:yes gene_type:complete